MKLQNILNYILLHRVIETNINILTTSFWNYQNPIKVKEKYLK